MHTSTTRCLGLALLFILLAALPMAHVLVHTDEVLGFNDGSIETNISPIYRFPAALVRVWDNQSFFGMGAKQYWLSVHALNESLLGAHAARREGVVLILALCALAWYWALRQFRVRPAAAAFAAGATMLSGLSFSFAVAGLYVRPIAVAFSALAVGLAERARARDGWFEYGLAGACIGLGVAEVPDVGAFCALTAAAVIGIRHLAAFGFSPPALLRLGLRGALVVGIAVLFAFQTVVNISATTIQGVTQGESPEERYAWATQWSIPPGETWDIVAGSHFGGSMNDPKLPYRGGIGRSEGWEKTGQGFRNFRMSAWYAGVIPSLLLLSLLPRAWRRRSPVLAPDDPPVEDSGLVRLVLGGVLVTLLLSWGKHFPLYKLLWSLPYFGTIRNPEKWNGPFTLFLTLGVALALDAFLAALAAPARPAKKGPPPPDALRPVLLAAAALGAVAVLLLFGTLTGEPGFVDRLRREGFGDAAPALWTHALLTNLKVIVLCAAFGAAAWWAARLRSGAPLLAAACLLTGLDLVNTGRRYAVRHAYKPFLAPNALTAFLDQHAREGRVLILPPQGGGQQGAMIGQVLNQMRSTMLQARGYDLFNPISVSRMPTDYESLFAAVGFTSPRLFELGSIRWILTVPGIAEALNQMDGNRGRFVERLALALSMQGGAVIPVDGGPPEQRVLRVVEFTGALPKFQPVTEVRAAAPGLEGEREVLARLADPAFDPTREAVVHDAEVSSPGGAATVEILDESPARTTVRVTADAPGLLVRSVRYDPDWKVEGPEGGRLLRVNYLLQGIAYPAGMHTLVLRYAPSLLGLGVAVIARIALLGALVVLLLRSRAAREETAGATAQK